tara:strand:+ start:3041 stop:3919 length:879 start_codon:yes stop_codon:yes gene_type:complete
MTLKCYNRQRNNGSSYTTCKPPASVSTKAKKSGGAPAGKRAEIRRIEQLPEADRKTKIDLRSQNKNISNNKMPPKKTTYGTGKGRSRGSWSEQEIAITDKLLAKYPTLSPFVAGKRFMVQKSKVIQIKSILKGKEDNDLFDKMISLRNERKKQEKEAKAGSKAPAKKAPAKAKMKKEDEVRPASKPAPKKVSVSYRVGSGPMKTAPGIVGKTSTSRKVVATKKPVVKKPDRRKSSAPMKNAKTAPKKIARFDMASGRTGNAIYEALGEGIGIPRYGNVVTPGQVMLKRNRRK